MVGFKHLPSSHFLSRSSRRDAAARQSDRSIESTRFGAGRTGASHDPSVAAAGPPRLHCVFARRV
jgi:hypothetical protein